jgi:putative ABC transport system substrate-binding protein
MIDRRKFLAGMGAALFAQPLVAEAQQTGKVYRVGWVTSGQLPFLVNFREGMRDLGYVEGQNLLIVERYTDGKAERLPGLLAELLRLNSDILVTSGSAATRAAREASTSVPVVFVTGDPVGDGFVSSLSGPGGTLTGLALVNTEVSQKWIELLRETLPHLSRVAALFDPNATRAQAQAVMDAARSLKLELLVVEARDADGIGRAFQRVVRERVRAIALLSSAMFSAQKQHIVSLSARYRLGAVYESRDFVEAGGLMSYGPDYRDVYRRAAGIVHRILRGTKPADLPVEQPTKYELVINLKTAKALGLTIPPSLLGRADEVIQ